MILVSRLVLTTPRQREIGSEAGAGADWVEMYGEVEDGRSDCEAGIFGSGFVVVREAEAGVDVVEMYEGGGEDGRRNCEAGRFDCSSMEAQSGSALVSVSASRGVWSADS